MYLVNIIKNVHIFGHNFFVLKIKNQNMTCKYEGVVHD